MGLVAGADRRSPGTRAIVTQSDPIASVPIAYGAPSLLASTPPTTAPIACPTISPVESSPNVWPRSSGWTAPTSLS